MKKPTDRPTPVLLKRGKNFSIVWRRKKQRYVVSLGISDELFARRWLADFALALASDRPIFPQQYAFAPAVRKYLSDWYDAPAVRPALHHGDILAAYADELRASVTSATWAATSLMRLRRLADTCGPLLDITTATADQYLTSLPYTPATRNRHLIVFSRFYKWCIRTGRASVNPFAGIKQVRESRPIVITYCTASERKTIIDAARASGRPEWLAVPIALYAGLRRGEIAGLLWSDIRRQEGHIVVQKTKTGRARLVPLHRDLIALLPADGKGYAVDIPKSQNRSMYLELLLRHLRPMLPTGTPCGWNIFRHTFGSLLAQSGVPIDKICAWMGNTPQVCRAHYAQFVPRDGKDADIDKM